MNRLTLAAPAALLLVLSACASGPGQPGYGEELRQLRADCEARSGFLMSTGATTGRPQTEYACQIRDPATRLPAN